MNKFILTTLLFIFGSCAQINYKSLQFRDGCTLYSVEGKDKTVFPNAMCIFLDDGSIISSGGSIRRIASNLSVMWEIPGQFHHQTNLSIDGKRILAMHTEYNKVGDRISRDDVLVVISIDGKILHRRTIDSIYKELKLPLHEHVIDEVAKKAGAHFERSHFNSIYEIPKNALSDKLESHREGNIIANSVMLGFFIFSPDLSRVLYHKELLPSHQVHDAQVMKTGELIYFNNCVVDEFKNPYSAIEQFDTVKNKVSFSFTAEPKGIWFAATRGGVQEYDDDIIFVSANYYGGFFYSRKKNAVIYTVPGKDGDVMKQEYIQDIKIMKKKR